MRIKKNFSDNHTHDSMKKSACLSWSDLGKKERQLPVITVAVDLTHLKSFDATAKYSELHGQARMRISS